MRFQDIDSAKSRKRGIKARLTLGQKFIRLGAMGPNRKTRRRAKSKTWIRKEAEREARGEKKP